MLKRALIRQLVIDALKGFPTLARDRVYSLRDMPTKIKEYPLLNVDTPQERKESLGRNAPQYTTTATVIVTGTVASQNYADTVDQLEALSEQVVRAVVNDPPLYNMIQQITTIDTQLATNSDGADQLGMLMVNFSIEYYEGPEDFHPLETDAFNDIAAQITLPDSVCGQEILIRLPQ